MGSRRNVLVSLTLLLVGFGGALAAGFTHGVWLVPLAYAAGAAAAWLTFGAAVKLGIARQAAAIEANRDEIIARLKQAAQQKGSGK